MEYVTDFMRERWHKEAAGFGCQPSVPPVYANKDAPGYVHKKPPGY